MYLLFTQAHPAKQLFVPIIWIVFFLGIPGIRDLAADEMSSSNPLHGSETFPWEAVEGEPLLVTRVSLDFSAFARYEQLLSRLIEYHQSEDKANPDSEGFTTPTFSDERAEETFRNLSLWRDRCKKCGLRALWFVYCVGYKRPAAKNQYPRGRLNVIVEHLEGATVPNAGWRTLPIIAEALPSDAELKPYNTRWTRINRVLHPSIFEETNTENVSTHGQQLMKLMDTEADISFSLKPSSRIRDILTKLDMTKPGWDLKQVSGYIHGSDAGFIKASESITGKIDLSHKAKSRIVFHHGSEEKAKRMTSKMHKCKQWFQNSNLKISASIPSTGFFMPIPACSSIEHEADTCILRITNDNVIKLLARLN